MITIKCQQCGGEFQDYASNHRKFCSMKCRNKSDIGKPSWNKGLKGYKAGEKHWNWQNGITSEYQKIRNSPEHIKWANEVYKKDKWICYLCSKKCLKGDIVAHHLKSFLQYPKLRFDINNGITLCRNCHMEIHRKELLNAKNQSQKISTI